MEEDGLYLPDIKAHSLEKIRRHNYYAALFAGAMRRKWRHRVYIGLYAGAGRARVQPSGELVETSALAVLRLPFTRYIFVDSDSRCAGALRARVNALGRASDVTLIECDVNTCIPAVVRALPRFSASPGDGMIALCFVDPFRIDLDFRVLRELSRFKIDFLVMLPFGYDLRRNVRRYLDADEDDRVAALIDAPMWREEWTASGLADRHFVRFVLQKFDQAMERLGFLPRKWDDTVPVKVSGMGVYLYSLALYTRHELGAKFWKTTVAGAEPQYGLDL